MENFISFFIWAILLNFSFIVPEKKQNALSKGGLFWHEIGIGNLFIGFFWANHFFWAKEWFAHEKEWITLVSLLSWAMGETCSRLLFWKEQWERFAHGCSFVKSNESESLPSLFNKDNWVKSKGSDSHLGIKLGRAVQYW